MGCGGSTDKEKCDELRKEIEKLKKEHAEKEIKQTKAWFGDEKKEYAAKLKKLEDKIADKDAEKAELRIKRGQNQFNLDDPLKDINLTPEEQLKVDKKILENLKHLNKEEHKDDREIVDAFFKDIGSPCDIAHVKAKFGEDAEKLLKRYDLDEDGTVSQAEFLGVIDNKYETDPKEAAKLVKKLKKHTSSGPKGWFTGLSPEARAAIEKKHEAEIAELEAAALKEQEAAAAKAREEAEAEAAKKRDEAAKAEEEAKKVAAEEEEKEAARKVAEEAAKKAAEEEAAKKAAEEAAEKRDEAAKAEAAAAALAAAAQEAAEARAAEDAKAKEDAAAAEEAAAAKREVKVKGPKMPSTECEVKVKGPKMPSTECEVKVKGPKMPSVECEVKVKGPKMPSVECEVKGPKMPSVECEVKGP